MGSPIALSHGPSLAGVFVSCMASELMYKSELDQLYGCTVLQTYYYWTSYPNDPSFTRYFVLFLLIMDTASTVFAIDWIYNLVINNFGNLIAFNQISWVLIMDPIFVCIIATSCQLFFARRVRIITQKLWLGLLVAGFSIACGLCTLGTAIALTMIDAMTEFHRIDPIVYPWLVSSAWVDLLTTFILTIHLRGRNHRTGFRQTELLINKLIRITIANGMLTALAALLEFIFFVASPDTGIHILFSFLIPKIYVNSVLSSLNQRKSAAGAGTDGGYSSNGWSEPTGGPSTSFQLRSVQKRGEPDAMVIAVNTERHDDSHTHSHPPINAKSEWAAEERSLDYKQTLEV